MAENKNEYEILDEDISKAVDKVIEEMEEKDRKLAVFQKSREDKVMEEIYQYLVNSKDEYIDDEDILYFPENYSFTLNEFAMIFDDLTEYAKAKELVVVEEDDPFPNANYCLKYKDKDIYLRIAYGQGTSLQMRIDMPEYWDENKSFSYLDYKGVRNHNEL